MSQSPKRILCVDDEPENLKLFEAILGSQNYQVLTAKNSRAAILTLSYEKVDLVILDMIMPEMDGLEVCRIIKEAEQYRHIPVVLVMTGASKQDKIRGIEAGADDFISKPIDQDEVLARVKKFLKVKELNDQLQQAFSNMTSLATFGEKIIFSKTLTDFSFEHNIDHMFNQFIRNSPETIGKPQAVFLGIKNSVKSWQLFQYESNSGGISKKSFQMPNLNGENYQKLFHDFQWKLMSLQPQNVISLSRWGEHQIVFCNESGLQHLELKPFVKKLESIYSPMTNMIGYLSDDLFMFALNYGRDITKYDATVLNSLVLQFLFFRSIANQARELEHAFEYTVFALARAAEVFDMETGNHVVRVGEYCAVLAENLGMDPGFVREIRFHSVLHDVGKIQIPIEVLRKPAKLSFEEFELMKKHTTFGANIIGDHEKMKMDRLIALNHHEKWDGTGYPKGLAGEQIPVEARICTFGDQYDALRSHRVYKPTIEHNTACKILIEGDGRTSPTHFDPNILEAFKKVAPQFDLIYESLKE